MRMIVYILDIALECPNKLDNVWSNYDLYLVRNRVNKTYYVRLNDSILFRFLHSALSTTIPHYYKTSYSMSYIHFYAIIHHIRCLGVHVSFQNKSNTQIINELAKLVDTMRLKRGLQQKEMQQKGGIPVSNYDRFVNTQSDIRMSSFIGILRAFDKLDAFEKLFEDAEFLSIVEDKKPLPKRISKKTTKKVAWKDDA